MPSFLDLPIRSDKPRPRGLTHIIDGGSTVGDIRGIIEAAGDYIDVWKFGWGTSYVDPTIAEKVALLKDHGIITSPGGTLTEVAWTQDRASEFFQWAHQVGFDAVEVSRGVAAMTVDEKHRLIEAASKQFAVLSEVGRKDSEDTLSPDQWARESAGDLAAGARWIIAEGRESGTVGLYHSDGTIRTEIMEAILEGVSVDNVFFEAPQKNQQAYLVHEFGPEVNLANIPLHAGIALETLRLGLRADTFGLSQRWAPILP